jgi:hypothetical protein
MLTRAYTLLITALVGVAPCHAGKPVTRDGSTIARAIPLKQRGSKAVEEEMAWMMKLYHYSPALTARDDMIDVVSKVKAGKRGFDAPMHWEHATLEHGTQWCSYWSFLTPQGRKKIYFDTGIPLNMPGEVQRQERVRAQYMARAIDSSKVQ